MTPGSFPDPVAVAVAVADRLAKLNIHYLIGGSFASSLHGEPRSTNDIDFVVDMNASTARRFAESLGADFYVDADVAVEAARTGGSFNLVHIATAIKVDLFVAGSDPFDRERLRRRQFVRLETAGSSTMLHVDSAEDIVLRKLEWFRRGGEVSERQWRDVIAVLGAQRQLDLAHLERWANQLGVADLLARAFAEAKRA